MVPRGENDSGEDSDAVIEEFIPDPRALAPSGSGGTPPKEQGEVGGRVGEAEEYAELERRFSQQNNYDDAYDQNDDGE